MEIVSSHLVHMVRSAISERFRASGLLVVNVIAETGNWKKVRYGAEPRRRQA